MKNIKSKLKMSLLEKLPTELLERVYLYAMDINLPRSSPIIAGKLSREMIYIKTVLAAFDPTWDGHGRRVISEDPNAASFQVSTNPRQSSKLLSQLKLNLRDDRPQYYAADGHLLI